MIYVKLFETTSAYNTYKQSADFITPNVSLCEDAPTTMYYEPYVEPQETIVVTKHNITDTSNPTYLVNEDFGIDAFSAIEIDGVTLPYDSVTGGFTFSTTGEHTVKYTLTNPTIIDTNAFNQCDTLISVDIPNSITSIGNNAFKSCSNLTSIDIPDSVTSIGESAFELCSSLTDVTIGNSVTSIGKWAFCECYGLESITINATEPPTIGTDLFGELEIENFTIYVPSGSVDTYKAANGWSDYASIIQAIS